jgi:hypothetical protein
MSEEVFDFKPIWQDVYGQVHNTLLDADNAVKTLEKEYGPAVLFRVIRK